MSKQLGFSIEGVSKVFKAQHGTVTALDNISLSIEDKEFVAILGTSGCGKSTMLRLLCGLDEPTSGQIFANGRPVNGPGFDRGMVFQAYSLFPWMTVEQNIQYGLKKKKLPKKEIREITERYIGIMGLQGFEKQYSTELSGGMKQRVAIARALATNPDSLLLDEPFGALDMQTKINMQEFTLGIWAENPKTIVMVTHDVEEAVFMASRIIVLSSRPGRVKEIIDIDLPRPRDRKIKSSPEFIEYKRHAMELIYEEYYKLDQVTEGAGE